MDELEAKNLPSDKSCGLVVFALDEQRYALRLSAVERVVRVVAITPLPKAPAIVLGVVNFQGRVLPVLDVRQRFRLLPRELHLSDQLVLARTARRPVLLLVGEVVGVIERSAEGLVSANRILPQLEYVEGVTRFEDSLVLIHDLDRFLSLEEENLVRRALANYQEAGNA